MKLGELIKDSKKYGWDVKSVRYISDGEVLFEFEKNFGNKKYHIYVFSSLDGKVMKGFNFFQNEVPMNLNQWDNYVQ